MILHKSYKDMTDKEIVDLAIAGNEEAMLYLLHDRYENDLKFYAWRYYDSLMYLEDMTNYLYIQFKGKKGGIGNLGDLSNGNASSELGSVELYYIYFRKREMVSR